MSAPRILVADDQKDVLEALRLLLKGEGFEVETAASPAAILSALDVGDFDAALMDLNYTRDTTSGREGFDLLTRIQALDATLPVIVMTAWGSVDGAVEAMRRGARDYVQKPWDNARLLAQLRTQVELARALRRTQRLEEQNRLLRQGGFPELIAESPAMQPVLRLMERVGPSDASVLITGEHGTGKELVAQWLHAASARAPRALVAVNVGGLSEGVFESELFGHVKGAFTGAAADRPGLFEQADGSTLLLDEIGELPLPLQSKLLRVLQEGEIRRVGDQRTRRLDVRLLAATAKDLAAEARAGRFREDLFDRLNVIAIHLPPLAERREDIAPLARHFVAQLAHRFGRPLSLSAEALTWLEQQPWPGNIRQLEHSLERAAVLSDDDVLEAGDLRTTSPGALAPRSDAGAGTLSEAVEAAERAAIGMALEATGGNRRDAAQKLGISLRTLFYKLRQYDLE